MKHHPENSNEEFDYKKLLEETSSDKQIPVKHPEQKNRSTWALILVAIGVILMLNNWGVNFPGFFLKWEYLVIIIGLAIGYNNNWKNGSWVFAVAVGAFFLIGGFVFSSKVIFPILLIALGWYWYQKDGIHSCSKHRKNQDIERSR